MNIDKDSKFSLTRQLYQQLKNMITEGNILPGERLPSTRALAKEVNVSRNTILEVYNQLLAEGYLEAYPGSGTIVANGIRKLASIDSVETIEEHSKQSNTEEAFIDFRSGVPDLELFPRKEWARLSYEIYSALSPSSLRYQPSYGVSELREAIVQYLYRTRGIQCRSDHIMIVTGSTQGLSLISKLLYQEGSRVLMEDPSHPGLRNVIASVGYEIKGISVDDKGMITDQLEKDDHVAFLYTTPSHQYPLGGILPIQRRIELMQYAQSNGCYIIEDDYDSEFRFEGQPVHSLYELNPQNVIYLGSFSKILAPAIRLGFLLLPEELSLKYKSLKMYSDVHTEAISQYVLAKFIQSGGMEKHIRKMKKLYDKKREYLIEVIKTNYPGEFTVKGQAAGLHLVVNFPDVVFTSDFMDKIYSAKLKVYPLQQYTMTNPEAYQNEIIIGYAHLSYTDISTGISALCKLLRDQGK